MKKCFVIMGFGKKVDYLTTRTLDLDQTYKNIIQPAVKNAGYECIRADEIQDSGIIDRSMYLLLLCSELVIADISTFNPNAIYELGIRHAVKPYSTIVIKEEEGKIPFDIDHTRIFKYKHQGDDIGMDEALRCQEELLRLINSVTESEKVDSPLYEFLNVDPPIVPESEMKEIINELAEKEKHIFAIVETASEKMKNGEFDSAAKYWERASNALPNEIYFVQQHALSRYKSEHPSKQMALSDALTIINQLEPEKTNDPETLGITGAIYKNLHRLNLDINFLDRAIHFYGRGYKLRDDYYTGENYALCLDLRASFEDEYNEKIYLTMEARKTREAIILKLENMISFEEVDDRHDKKWIFASLASCNKALGENETFEKYRDMFMKEEPDQWEIDTFENNLVE